MSDKSTSSLVVDISKLKEAVVKAEKAANAARAEFRKTTAGMDNWSKSTEGLNAKIKQLNTSVEAEKLKLESLEAEYKQIVEKEGESSAAAKAHQVKIDNQTASVIRAEKELQKYKDKLSDLESDYSKATQEISKQEDELEALKKEYANIILTQDKSSATAQEVAAKIGKLSTELQENKKALEKADSAADEFDNTLEKVDDSAEEAGDGFTVMKGALANLVADGIRNIASNLATEIKNMFVESTKAYSNFQAQTGESTEAMAEFKEEINDLYKNNYGDSLEDIAEKMAYVKQVTGEANPSKLRELTENAIALEDTFDSDFNETIRGVSNLMEHFEIDSKEAFDLFAKGSQKGLDYTGELGDNVAEYGGNFKQAGYSAQEYFQLLENGSQGGAYNLDKVNDSINEIKNRLGDGSIKKNLKIYSKNTKNTFHDWEDGKSTMKDVIDSIVSDIKGCKNEQEALNMAAVAFGTMGEDANLDVVKSLTTVGHSFKDVKGSMEGIKKIKYDNIEDQFKTIGRRLQMDFLAPLAQKAMPYVEKFADYCVNNLEKIVPVLKTIGITIATVFTVNTVAKFGQSLGTIVAGLGKVSSFATPIGLVTAGFAGFTALIGASIPKESNFISKNQELLDQISETSKKLDEENTAWKDLTTERQKSVDETDNEFQYYQDLKKELDKITDKNGEVKKGYEDRAQVIVQTLNDSLDADIKYKNGVVDNWDKIGASIDKVIEKRKAEAILSAYKNSYEAAIKDNNTITADKEKYKQQLKQLYDDLDSYEKELKTKKKKQKNEGFFDSFFSEYNNLDLTTNIQKTKDKIKEAETKLAETEKTAQGYLTTITNYENLSAAIISGNEKKINDSLLKIQNGFVSYKNATKDILKKQVENTKSTWESLSQAYENGEAGVTKKAVNNAKKLYDAAIKELDKFKEYAKKSGKKNGEDYSKGIASTAPKAQKSGKNLAKESKKGAASVSLRDTGKYFGEGFIIGLSSTDHTAEEMTMKWGINRVKNLNKSVETGSPSKATTRTGIFFAQGFINGIKSLIAEAKAESKSLGGSSLKALLLGVDNGKYSKVGEKLVKHFTNGINSQAKNIVKTMKNLITNSIPKNSSSIEKAKKEFEKVAKQLTDSFSKALEKGASKAVKKVEKAFESISEEYQDKYDEIIQKQEDLQNTLSDYGSLFERDDDGKIELSNLNEQINYLKTYDSNLKALKSKVSSNLMGVITSMSAEDGADLAAKLLSLSPEELKAFDTAYLEKQKISSQIAKDYYKSEVQSLKDNFTKAINKQLKTLKKDLKEVGKQAVEGFIKGFKSKNSDVSDTVEAWAKSIIKTVKKQLKIKSPSRVFRYEIAGNVIDGFIKGIATRTRSAVNTMKEFSNKMTDSANISIGSAKRGMMLSSGGAVATNNNNTTYNFYQTNNSPKALSRLEIYRQSRNLLNFKAGLKGV